MMLHSKSKQSLSKNLIINCEMEKENPELYFPELSPIENNLLGQNYSVDDGEALLIITIVIGDGRKDEIKVYEHDDSDQLALDFCHKHRLGARAKLLLADEIEKYLKIALSKAKSLTPNSANKSTPTIQKDNLAQSPQRPRRNQNFTQKSMQVRQNMLRNPSQGPSLGKIPVSLGPNRLASGTESPESQKLRRSNSKGPKTNNPMVYQHSKKPQNFAERSSKRANSLYDKKKFTEAQKTEESDM